MDKNQLRQSAADDFMQSLEHLDQLLGETAETVALDEGSQASDMERAKPLAARMPAPSPTANNTQAKR